MHYLVLFLGITFFSLLTPAYACGVNTNCDVADGRYYRIMLPETHDKQTPNGAIFYAHSLGTSAASVIRRKSYQEMASRLGVALIALKAVENDWNVRNSPAGRSDRSSNEFSYLDNVIDDVVRRFAVDRDRIVLAGGSVGGTFTWTMACTGINRFAGYIPLGGTYWLNPPEDCSAQPANVIHIHGTADVVVPLTGRQVGTSRHSNVLEVIKAYRKIGNYSKAGTFKETDLTCETSKNRSRKIVDFCLHSGGHVFEARHIEFGWKRFKALGVL
ncbi:MAG: hypothetical protein QNJ29_06070 [Rhizobiaceae bacterium]|nr:hypothetical protein [Rhizobiaceae bacterium]